ncbi:MAG TPA: deoxyribose-phosphate aldolase [Gemmatimonadaceae bacterium]
MNSEPSVASPVSAPPPGVSYARADARLADFIDHTFLKPDATGRDIETLCREAAEHRFAAVCVNPVWVPMCVDRLAGSEVKVATVVGFPLGASEPEGKAAEAARAAAHGADEVDMVAAIGQMKSGDWGHVARDIEAVVCAVPGRLVKVIIESALLSPMQIVQACRVARDAGAHYVKTSTGFSAAGGATVEAVALMRLAVGDALGVKASGGIRDGDTAFRMIAAGATRIGTSSGVAMAECHGRGPRPLGELLATA